MVKIIKMNEKHSHSFIQWNSLNHCHIINDSSDHCSLSYHIQPYDGYKQYSWSNVKHFRLFTASLKFYCILYIMSMIINNCDAALSASSLLNNVDGDDHNQLELLSDRRMSMKAVNKREIVYQQIQSPHKCSSNADCLQVAENSFCHTIIGKCMCSDGFKLNKSNNITCIRNDVINKQIKEHNVSTDKAPSERSSSSTPPSKFEASHMLPIMIVLGVMFVGMCVALNLFSRARFQQHRGIFTNTHLIKFGKSSSSSTTGSTKRKKIPPNNANTKSGTGFNAIPGPSYVNNEKGIETAVSFDSIALES